MVNKGMIGLPLLLIFILQSIFPFLLHSTQPLNLYQHHILTRENGLPLDSILSITQTHDGYIWLGLETGLVRFDGVKFQSFTSNYYPVISLKVDNKGILWAGTRGGGVLRYKNGKILTMSKKNGLLSNEVWVILPCPDGTVWLGTKNGLNRLYMGKISRITLPEKASSHHVISIIEDRKGRLWVGTKGGGLIFIKKNRGIFDAVLYGLDGKNVQCLLQDRKDTIWIGTRDTGLIRLKEEKLVHYSRNRGLAFNNVTCLYKDINGNLWIGTYGNGINVIENNTTSTYVIDDKLGLASTAILSFHEDKEGTLWFGTEGGGLNYLRETKIFTYTTANGLSNNIIYSVFQDKRGDIWAGTLGSGVNRLNPRTKQITTFTTRDGLSSNIVVSIAEEPAGIMWFGTIGGGINRLQLKNGQIDHFTRQNGLSNNSVRVLYLDPDGILWAGMDNGCIQQFFQGKFHMIANVKFRVTSILKDQKGNIWIGTLGRGLCQLKKNESGHLTEVIDIKGYPEKIVMGIHEDQQGLLWVGSTNRGLFCLNDGQFINIGKKNGIPDTIAYCIIEDEVFNLWISSNHGIYYLKHREIEKFLRGDIKKFNASVFDINDGLKSLECNGGNQPSGCRSSNGKIWFPTTKGLSVIDPDNIGLNPLPPTVVIEKVVSEKKNIEGVISGNAPSESDKSITLPGGGNLKIHFTALSFIAPKEILFKYRLHGFNPQWSEAGNQRYAIYKSLPPGTYNFQVIACNSDSIWNNTGAYFNFKINPKYYQTTIFKIGIILIVIFFIYSVYWMVQKKHMITTIFSKKYKDSTLSKEDSKKYLQKILYLIEEQKIFKDPNVSLKVLSNKLILSPRTVSQVINQELKKNFFELINYYRVEEAKKMMTDPEKLDISILDICYDVGFNSRSAFNRVFKKFTSMNPSSFRKKTSHFVK